MSWTRDQNDRFFFPVYEIKEYRGSRRISPHVDKFGTSRWGVINIKPRERTPLPIEVEAVWPPEQVWLVWSREKSLVSARIQIPHRPARSVVTMPNTLPCQPPPPPAQLSGRYRKWKKNSRKYLREETSWKT
jgi:hypothetical protein